MGRERGPQREPASRAVGSSAQRLVALIVLGAALALLLLAGSSLGHHTNTTCAGGYTQVWNAPVTVLAPSPPIVNECILVQANVTVDGGGELRFRDSKLVFDNELGNFTFFVNSSALLEFRDDDGSTATNDRSWLGLLNNTISWTGYFFGNSPGARIFFNDTDIEGGGLPGPGLSSATAFFVESPSAFSWNRVGHFTASSGLVLANYTAGLTIPSYDVNSDPLIAFVYGLALYRCENITVTGYSNSAVPGATGIYVEGGRNITIRNSTATTAAFGMRFLLTTNLLVEDSSSVRHGDTGFYLDRVDSAVLNRVRATPPISGRFGISLVSSLRIDVNSALLQRHDTADLSVSGTTRWVNVTDAVMTLNTAGSGLRAIGTGDVNSAADLNFRNLNVTRKGPPGGFAVYLDRVNRVTVQGYLITQSSGAGLLVSSSSDVRFSNGSIVSNTQGAALSTSGNLSFVNSSLSSNAGGGLTVTAGSFNFDQVQMLGNGGWSIRSTGIAQLTGNSTIRNSTLEGVTGAVIDLKLIGGSGSGSLTVIDTQFVRSQNTQQLFYALDIDGLTRLTVQGGTMNSYGVRVNRTAEVTLSGTTMDVVLLPVTTTLLRFDQVATLAVEGVRFGAAPLGGKLATIANVSALVASAVFSDSAYPRADYGLIVQGQGGTFSAALVATNLTMTALIDGVTARTMHDVTINGLTVYRSTRAVVLQSSGTSARFAVANATLQASSEGIRTLTDVQATVEVSNITFDRTNSTPPLGVTIAYAQEVALSGVRVAGLPTGIDVLDGRTVRVSDMDFIDNQWGLRLLTNPGTRSDLNWTISRDTLVSNSHLLIRGDVWVTGARLTLTANSSLEIYSTIVAPAPTRFRFEGASGLSMDGSARIIGREGLPAAGTVDARFTLELSALSTVSLQDATLDRLGVLGPALPEQKGLYVRAQATTVTNVSFLNVTGAIRSVGVDVTIIGCVVSGMDGQDLAVDVEGANLTIGGGTLFHMRVDGVRITDGEADISNTTFDGVGAALTARASTARFMDSTVVYSSEAVHATSSSNVVACRLTLLALGQTLFVDSSSTLHVCDTGSHITPRDGEVRGGGLAEYDNVFVGRFDENGRMTYIVETPGSTFRAYWGLNVFVSSCPTNYTLPISGAAVQIVDRMGTIVFMGTTGANGYAGPARLLHYESVNNVETYYTPFTFSSSLGTISTSATHQANQTSNIEVCLDDQAPDINLLPPTSLSPPPTRNASIDLRGRVVDNVSGLASGYPCIIAVRDSPTCLPVPASFDTQRPLREGINTFLIVARDNYGNERQLEINVERDTTPPAFLNCDPGFAQKVGRLEVDLVCQMAGSPLSPPTITNVTATGGSIDGNGVLRAHITLLAGQNTFRIIVQDALFNRNDTASFSWVADLSPPAPTLQNGYNETVTRLLGVFLTGVVPQDTETIEWGADVFPFASAQLNLAWDNLSEGHNERELRITDDVGNVWQALLWLEVDIRHNCTLFTPAEGEIVSRSTVTVGGTCDPDVVLQVAGVAGQIVPQSDGHWTAQVPLEEGPNLIEINGEDASGVRWNVSVTVRYDPATDGEGLPFAFIALIIMAAVVFVVAILVLRRPRPPRAPEAPRPLTGAQKAPPRPKPPTTQLPEKGEADQFRRPPPPP